LTFAIVGAALTLAGLAWTITWAVRSFRKSGAEVFAELGQGYVDEDGLLKVVFQDGRSKLTRIEGDPWEGRKQAEQPKPQKMGGRTARRKVTEAPDQEHQWQPVNAIFVRNSGRAAITVSRCSYFLELDLGRTFDFEPQPHASPWGDLLPKRVEAGNEIILIHDKQEMWGLLNGVLRDHGVFQTVYGVYVELGSGETVFAGPPIGVQAFMDDEEYAKVEDQLHREEYEGPEVEEGLTSRLKARRYLRWHRRNVVMEEDVHPELLQMMRGKAADRLIGQPRKLTKDELAARLKGNPKSADHTDDNNAEP
jgi:hypothetical protein